MGVLYYISSITTHVPNLRGLNNQGWRDGSNKSECDALFGLANKK